MTRRAANPVLVPCPMNVDEPIAGIGIVVVQAIQPENPRHYQILSRGQRVLRTKGNPAAKNRSARHIATDFLGNAKVTGRRFEASFLSADPKTRAGDRIRPDSLPVAGQGELLVANRNIDPRSWTLHELRPALHFGRR